MFDPQQPYNDLPRLPPPFGVESRRVLKKCVTVHTALAELRIAGQLLPDQSVLINAIPLLEAKASSEIENIVTTNDALFREASLTDIQNGDPAAKEAIRYRTALYAGFLGLSEFPIATRTAVEVCRTIKGADLDIRTTSGTSLKNTYSSEVIYTPPEGVDLIRELLANWEIFINQHKDLDPVVRMAIQHYQFEAIHPFIDGNGRTGRVLNILTLIQDGLLNAPTLYLSRHILRTKSEYYRLLLNVTANGDWESWILYMLEAVEVTARWTNNKVRAIRALMDDTAMHVRASAPKIYSRELIDLVFTQPYCRIGNLVDRGIAKRQAASTYLKTLGQLGLMQEEKVGRDKVFIHRKYLDLLASDEHTFVPYARIGAAI